MYLTGVFIVLCGFIGERVCHQPDEYFNKLYDPEWQCDTVCVGSGGKPEFDLKNKICKCVLDENIDDVDREAILKNANALGMQITLTRTSDKEIAKREVDTNSQQIENIVGQRSPQRIVNPRPRPVAPFSTSRRPTIRTTHRPPITSTRRRTSSRRPENVQQRLQRIQSRLNERRRSRTRTRSRTGPHLQQRAGFAEETTPNAIGRLREKQKERLDKVKNKNPTSVNAATKNGAKTSGQTAPANNQGEKVEKSKGEPGTNEKKSHEVITQNPSLY